MNRQPSQQTPQIKAALLLEQASKCIAEALVVLGVGDQPVAATQAGNLLGAARLALAQTDNNSEHKYVPSPEAYNRLLPKLLFMADNVDQMSEDEYGDWVDALNFDEFLEYMSLAHDNETFLAAVAEARAAAGAT